MSSIFFRFVISHNLFGLFRKSFVTIIIRFPSACRLIFFTAVSGSMKQKTGLQSTYQGNHIRLCLLDNSPQTNVNVHKLRQSLQSRRHRLCAENNQPIKTAPSQKYSERVLCGQCVPLVLAYYGERHICIINLCGTESECANRPLAISTAIIHIPKPLIRSLSVAADVPLYLR